MYIYMWHDAYAGQVLLLCHATCWILLRSAGTAWATLPVSRWTASQWVQGYAEFVRAITCHHVPWRAMTCHGAMMWWNLLIVKSSLPGAQSHSRTLTIWGALHAKEKWMERDGTRCNTFAFAEKLSTLFGEIYSNRTNMAQIASPC